MRKAFSHKLMAALSALLVVTSTGFLVVTFPGSASAQPTPPWQPAGGGQVGVLTFFDSSGNVVTGGNTTDALPAYAEGSNPVANSTAELLWYVPTDGEAPSAWTGHAASTAGTYPISSAPSPLNTTTLPEVAWAAHPATSSLATIGDLAAAYPNTDTSTTDGYAGIYEVRLASPTTLTTYDATDIQVNSDGTWQVVYPTGGTAPTSTTTTLTASSGSTSSYGSSVTLTVSISPAAATGTVQFQYVSPASSGSGNTRYDLGSAKTVSAGEASVTTSALPTSTLFLRAAFTAAATGSYAGSVATVDPYTVTSGTPTITLSASPASPQPSGTPVTLTATVTPASAAEDGEVVFYEGSTALDASSPALVNSDDATFTYSTSSLTVGTDSLNAVYTDPNDGNWSSVTATASYTVTSTGGPAPPTITLSASPASPQPSGTPVTLTATVTPASAAEDGEVVFYEGSTALDASSPALVNSDDATFTYSTSSLTVGTDSLNAVYTDPNDGNWSSVTATASYTVGPTEQSISLPGSPFAVTTTVDGQYIFTSLGGNTDGIAVIHRGPTSSTLLSVLATGGATFGLAVTPDGKYLLDTVQQVSGSSTPDGMQIIDIQEAIAGDSDAVLGTVPTGSGSGPIEVGLSNDAQYAFVTNEDNSTVSVINLTQALASNENASSVVGDIPVEGAPVDMAFSPDGRTLYVTNETADSTDPGYNPTACNTPTGIGTGTTPGPEGTLSVISVPEAEGEPAQAVEASVYAGCAPVRVELSNDGSIAWVTARSQDDVLAFSTSALLNDPSNALLSTTPVGSSPVGDQIFDDSRLIAVANSNRFATGQAGTVSILDYGEALDGAGSAATVANFPAGEFPRQWDVSNDGQYLYLTEYSSDVLAIYPVGDLVNEVRPLDPNLSDLPASPAEVTATAGVGSATVSWLPPADDGGSAITGYVISADDGVDPPITADVDDPNATSGVISGLTDGVDYDISVAALNTSGTGDAAEAAENPIEPLGVPVFTSGPSATFTVGQSGTFPVTATAVPAVTSYRETGDLPQGVSFSPDGTLAGTPADGTGGTYPITITASNGASATQSFTLSVASATTVTGVAPTGGPGAGGTKVTVTGTGFTGASEVLFGSVPGTSVKVNKKGTSLTVVSPTEAAGSVDITVTTANGTSVPNANDRFTFSAPVVTSVGPTSGPGAGATKVTISGVDLQGATTVSFGSTQVAVSSVNGAGTAALAVSPAGSGSVPVTVTTPGGTSSQDVTFTYLVPTITGLKAASGPAAGGNTVRVTGTNLQDASFEFGSVHAQVVSITKSGTRAKVVAPGQGTGADTVSATTSAGTSASTDADGYTYLPPTVTSVSPKRGSTAGGTDVTVHGADFQGATGVDFGGVAGTVTAVAAHGTTVTVTSPSEAAGSVDVTVTTANGGTSQVSAKDVYSYTAPKVKK